MTIGGSPRPLHPIICDEVYGIGREALVDAFRRPGATAVGVEIDYSKARLRVLVRADGAGPGSHAQGARPEIPPNLSRMRERAVKIGGRLKVRNRAAAGIEVELSVPSDVVFLPEPSPHGRRLFSKLFSRKAEVETEGRGGGPDV